MENKTTEETPNPSIGGFAQSNVYLFDWNPDLEKEYPEIPEDLVNKISEPLPQEAYKVIDSKSYLTSIKPIFITQRLNQCFGLNGWRYGYRLSESSSVKKGYILGEVVLVIPKYGIKIQNMGGNDNGGADSKNFDLGDAYKGAITDALTKCTSFLGIGKEVYEGKVKVPSSPASGKYEGRSSQSSAKPSLKVLDSKNQYTDQYKTVWASVVKGNYKSVQDIEKDFSISSDNDKKIIKQNLDLYFQKKKKEQEDLEKAEKEIESKSNEESSVTEKATEKVKESEVSEKVEIENKETEDKKEETPNTVKSRARKKTEDSDNSNKEKNQSPTKQPAKVLDGKDSHEEKEEKEEKKTLELYMDGNPHSWSEQYAKVCVEMAKGTICSLQEIENLFTVKDEDKPIISKHLTQYQEKIKQKLKEEESNGTK